MRSDSNSDSHWQYIDFDLEIDKGREPGIYVVTVRSPEGRIEEETRLPFDEWELQDKLKDVELALLRSRGLRRRIGTSEEQVIQGFGQALFNALFVGDVGANYEVSLRQAKWDEMGLRLKLHVRPPELSALPWEFVYDPKRDYVCLSTSTPLVRYADVAHPTRQLAVAPPLRILGMVASPQELPQLDVEHEKRLMEEAVKGLRAEGLVELTWLRGQTSDDLQEVLWRGPWHVFHFIGHGGFNPAADEGAIALSDEEGHEDLLGANDLALMLDDHFALRLVFLNSCEGARGSPRDAFSSTAATLVRYGLPAVVAMQYEITDEAAIAFSRTFYRAVAHGLPVDAAVAEARTAVKRKSALEWGTPVLYLRSDNGRLFDIQGLRRDPKIQEYRNALGNSWRDKKLRRAEVERLVSLKQQLKLSSDVADSVEREVIGDTIEGMLKTGRSYYASALMIGWGNKNATERRQLEREMPSEVFATATRLATDDALTSVAVIAGLRSLADELGLNEHQASEIEREVLGGTLGDVIFRDTRWWTRWKKRAAILGVTALVLIGLIAVMAVIIGPGDERATVPNIVGQTLSETERSTGRFKVNVSDVKVDSKPRDTIISQEPDAYKRAEGGSTISVVVSAGQPPNPGDIFTDSFSDTDKGWWQMKGEGSDPWVVDYKGGSYLMYDDSASKVEGLAVPLKSAGTQQDVIVEVDADVDGEVPDSNEPYWGLVCRALDAQNLYALVVYADRSSAILKYEDASPHVLKYGKTSDAVRLGTATNHLRADCIGNRLALYVNGHMVVETEDATYDAGLVGLEVSQGANKTSLGVLFDNFSVSSP